MTPYFFLSLFLIVTVVNAFVAPAQRIHTRIFSSPSSCVVIVASNAASDDFASFAASLDEDDEDDSASSSIDAEEDKKDWQGTLEDLLDPTTPLSKRQGLFTDLVSANQDIRSSVESAIRDRSIDPLLTPRGKRLREGSRAVARQISRDILPSLIESNRQSVANSPLPPLPVAPPFVPPPEDLQKVGTRIFNALQNRFQTDLETMQSDIQNDPLRSIPQRIQQGSRDLLKEAGNVFAETPQGLQEPPYTVVAQTADYEIRDYDAYTVASTNVAPVGQNTDYSLSQNGVAFNTLAAYVFGANKQGLSMEMTTPVTTTGSGEMRFYLKSDTIIPEPLEEDESNTLYERPGNILIQDIPPARLAVRRFTGFCTKGEVARQKETLLASLELDGQFELDVPHGATVPYVVFQYNPPYTLPVLRRNEIAVAVTKEPKQPVNDTPTATNGASASTTDSASSGGNDNEGGFASSIRDSWEPVD